MKPIIKIENLSKQYRLGVVGTGTLSNDLKRWWYKARGKGDPFLKIGDTNKRSTKGDSNYVWALKDINLEVMPGEVLGIIGKNGAGKSTLLKILSKVTGPTTGKISYNGRIGSLLEVGTGFHQELTGRENIFLNGAILGMTKAEIRSKLDEIVDFSGVERYIDTPVKRYSSGMMVRLGFAVAAHLEPEILVVDEVLAVGDAEFQKKAIGKMQDVSSSEGRTVLFVSHNMHSIKSICQSGVVLSDGVIVQKGKVQESVEFYINENYQETPDLYFDNLADAPGNENIKIKSFKITPQKGVEINVESGIVLKILFYNSREKIVLDVTFQILTQDDLVITTIFKILSPNKDSKKGLYSVEFIIPPFILNAGRYKIKLWFGESQRYLLWGSLNQNFEIENTLTGQGSHSGIPVGILKLKVDSNSFYIGEL